MSHATSRALMFDSRAKKLPRIQNYEITIIFILEDFLSLRITFGNVSQPNESSERGAEGANLSVSIVSAPVQN